ncbi:two component, sigma54 specific, transcriptional regulator, Fis family [Novosphingobium aromaticivorans DSM 12444]|uniref:DNA-binding transcriptional regulator NtrC n=1 Tax=Novosphingobium aromaticivorans (strain ATCC 700278 / DSM 12444 / CCUG 56034 / CIP 105152 / NBRC 16084 / F199) TaxID=279238 RepID=Q2G791_NOVAD|nr:sigma-54 dependent transcriptional regulator [Novosphingobium aromaticivorans]ABD26282.1 two component, sigma54 specific, transcriptional regulator, Fis family [Novosphingobium aromaticivorans DSM 12444]SCY55645.1 two component, sigma54 specific, transcriptional regulator, Fis family [Novosphingobium aromaticivorans]
MQESEQRLLMLIDDEPAQCRLISALASREGWRTIIARDSESAIATLGTRQGMQLGAIILDQWVPGDDACTLIAELKARRPALPILMLTTSSSPLLAVEAMRAGATDYLIKPVAPERLLQALRSATSRETSASELQPLTEKIGATLDFDSMIGASPAFRAALAVAAKAARTHGTVLIEGESGTGKEMLVRAMHAASPRAKAPLRIVNAGGTSASQLESALFGHEKGAFPGAFERNIGMFQHADGGTLVIDEVDRLPASVQERLVRFLTRGDIQPVGARHSFRVDVRLIVCANAGLRDLVHIGDFDADLHALLTQTQVQLPSLRERPADIPALARHFLARIGEQPGLRPLGITDGALALLAAYDWPGNVRQLQATLFRAAVFCDGEALTAQDFPSLSNMIGEGSRRAPSVTDGAGITLFAADGNLRPLEDIEADVIRLAIGHYRGRMTEVARRLGIGRSTLYRKLSELGIDNAA